MRSSCRIALESPGVEVAEQAPDSGRHEELVRRARAGHLGGDDVYVDCNASLRRMVHAQFVAPCLTPSHPVYSTRLKRYLTAGEHLNGQGLWKTCFRQETYDHLLANPKLAKDLAGNAMSSTVCQASFLASMIIAPGSWRSISKALPDHRTSEAGKPLLRIVKKRPAPEYGPPPSIKRSRTTRDSASCKTKCQKVRNNDNVKTRQKKVVKKPKRTYKRKVAGKDSRKNAKGKKAVASIWDKEIASATQGIASFGFDLS